MHQMHISTNHVSSSWLEALEMYRVFKLKIQKVKDIFHRRQN